MSPKDVTEYIEKKVISLSEFPHSPNQGRSSFFVIANPYDFDEFDNALRKIAAFPAVLCELVNGRISDNDSANHTNSIAISFMVLDKSKSAESHIELQSRCYELGLKLLNQIRKDGRAGVIEGKSVTVDMNSNYQPVGPLDSQYWGYQFDLTFTVSFGWCTV